MDRCVSTGHLNGSPQTYRLTEQTPEDYPVCVASDWVRWVLIYFGGVCTIWSISLVRMMSAA